MAAMAVDLPTSSSSSSFLPDASYSPIDLSLGELSTFLPDEERLTQQPQLLTRSPMASSSTSALSNKTDKLRFPAPPGHPRASATLSAADNHKHPHPHPHPHSPLPHAITSDQPQRASFSAVQLPHRIGPHRMASAERLGRAPLNGQPAEGLPSSAGSQPNGYLYLSTTNHTPVQSSPPQILHKLPPPKLSPKLTRSRSNSGKLNRSRAAAGETWSEFPPPVPALPAGAYGEEDEDDELDEDECWGGLSAEQGWYLTRALVGREIAREGEELWRLKSLEIDERRYNNPNEDEIDPTELPIARYFIRHFLLTLPLIRDCPPVTSQPSISAGPSTAAPFWSSGLFPLLRAVHDADLSDAFDHGRQSFWSNSALAGRLERFVAGGLKLSSERPRWPGHHQPKVAQAPTAQESQPTTATTIGRGPRPPHLSPDFSLKPPVNPNFKPRSPPISPGTQPPAPPAVPARNPARTSPQLADGAPAPKVTAVPLTQSAPAQQDGVRLSPQSTRSYQQFNAPPVPASPVESNYNMHRSASRGTGFQTDDGASFVSAREGVTSASEIEFLGDDDDDEDKSVYSPVSSPLSNSKDFEAFSREVQNPLGLRVGVGLGAREGSWYSERTAMAFTPTQPTHDEPARDDSSPVLGYTVRGESTLSHSISAAGTIVPVDRKGKRPASKSPPMASEPNQPASAARRTHAPPQPYYEHDSDEDADVEMDGENARGKWVSSHLNKHTSPAPAAFSPEIRAVMPAPLAVPEPEFAERRLIYKAGLAWPFGHAVTFFRAVPFQRLEWGGFEVDLVGMREGLFSNSYIIRVRRPARLDEYVVRTEAQFAKFQKLLEAKYPLAHLRRVPKGEQSAADDQLVKPNLLDRSASRASIKDIADGADLSRSRSRVSFNPEESRVSVVTKRSSGGSLFARSLKAQSLNGDLNNLSRSSSLASRAQGHWRAYSFAGSRRSSSSTLPSRMGIAIDLKKLPTNDPRRRAMRSWLRDTLSVKGVGHCKETAAFLLLDPITPKDPDVVDIMKREKIDEARRAARVTVAQGAAERARAAIEGQVAVERECVHGEGFVAMSDALRTASSIAKLPLEYRKLVEVGTLNFAQYIFERLVSAEGSASRFKKLKALHEAFPYFLVRQAFKFRSATMAKMLQDLLLARPFGKKSLLQKVLSTMLDDDTATLLQEINGYRAKIGSLAYSEKIDIYCYSSRERKQVIRQYARDHGLELVVCICRGGESPRLAPHDLSRIVRASEAHAKFVKGNPTKKQVEDVSDPDVALIVNLQMYLSTVSRDRDASLVRQLLGEDDVASALECVAGPFVEGLKRVYKFGGATAISDLQRFMDQLVVIVEALRARIQDPQKSIRILTKLLTRHQGALYSFVRGVHKNESLIEEFLQWAWTASVFLRRGLAEPLDLDSLLPPTVASPRPSQHPNGPEAIPGAADKLEEDPAKVYAELEDLVAWHKAKKARSYQALSRRLGGDVDGDDPIIVEGDGKGKSRTEPIVESSGGQKKVREVEKMGARFRDQLRDIFAV